MDLSAKDVSAMIANPFYAVTFVSHVFKKHSSLGSKEDWIAANAYTMNDISPKIWLEEFLDFMTQSRAKYDGHDILNPMLVVNVSDRLEGEHKVIANQRVTLAPAKGETRKIVRRIFDGFTVQLFYPHKIARLLNEEAIPSPGGKQWDVTKVIRILSNEQYIGTLIYNKTWKRLKQPQRANPVSEWVRHEDAFEGIVTREQFMAAQERLYWLLPYRYRYGRRRISAAKHQFKQYLKEQLIQLHDDDTFKVLHEFPVAFGLTFYRGKDARHCFAINEKYRTNEEVLCIGLDIFAKNKVDAIYRVPSGLFGIGDYLLVDKNDMSFQKYLVSMPNAGSAIDEIAATLTAP